MSATIEKLLLVSPWIDHSKPTCLAPSALLIVPLTPLNSYIDWRNNSFFNSNAKLAVNIWLQEGTKIRWNDLG